MYLNLHLDSGDSIVGTVSKNDRKKHVKPPPISALPVCLYYSKIARLKWTIHSRCRFRRIQGVHLPPWKTLNESTNSEELFLVLAWNEASTSIFSHSFGGGLQTTGPVNSLFKVLTSYRGSQLASSVAIACAFGETIPSPPTSSTPSLNGFFFYVTSTSDLPIGYCGFSRTYGQCPRFFLGF
ncbi:hypothetical protein PIB30_044740 [Stylosanthes scabra]|uniref:Uncharacterized protein n=1 Tax=Stylosanthes scabra TaxID=79078 RepID=A0ABU6YEL8_9FABA|nr:hypothetical protein [Stylosanthes scabra]